MWFNTDFKKLTVLHLPTFLRTSVMISWVQSLSAPLVNLHYDFSMNRKNNLYNLAHNGQVCKLRAVLNDRFDASLRRIYIDDGNKYQRQYIYTDGEQKPKYLGTIYLYNDSEYDDSGVDFTVWIPGDLQYNDYEIRALINFYKLASKRYKIKTF
jgi:hypothetical protein